MYYVKRYLTVAICTTLLYLPMEIAATYIGGYIMMIVDAFGGVGGI